jgi:hypothetical protein
MNLSSNTNNFLCTIVYKEQPVYDKDGFYFLYKDNKTIHDPIREIVFAQKQNGPSMNFEPGFLTIARQTTLCKRVNVVVTPENAVKVMFKSIV